MVRFPHPAALAVLGILGVLAGCSKKRDRAAEVRECVAIAADSAASAQCLVQLHHWDSAEARTAAGARTREVDSLRRHLDDSLWNLSAADHARKIAACRRGADPLVSCLLVSGWPLARARAAAESLWRAEAPKHRREIAACLRRRDVNVASCLQLYYKWDSDRAQRTADSLTRLRLGGRTAR